MISVIFTAKVQKQFPKIPKHILDRVKMWANEVGIHGIEVIRQVKGYRDHPLQGNRQGQRSVSLNKQWRLLYTEALNIIEVQEVTAHDYRVK